jgi:hypothetical protein
MKDGKNRRRGGVSSRISYRDVLALPPDAPEWGFADTLAGNGGTFAHRAAERGELPEGFDRWELADRDVLSVAHIAAKAGTLPRSFDQWDISDARGMTVAHFAVLHGKLPDWFDNWDIALRDDLPAAVRRAAAREGSPRGEPGGRP